MKVPLYCKCGGLYKMKTITPKEQRRNPSIYEFIMSNINGWNKSKTVYVCSKCKEIYKEESK